VRIAVVGTGYAGLVTGTCLAESGHRVACVDLDERKIGMLQSGSAPIYEPGLEELLRRNAREGRLRFTTSMEEAMQDVDVAFIAVGTRLAPSGEVDLSDFHAAAEGIARHLGRYAVVAIKSTVPVGSADKVAEILGRLARAPFDVVSNPEFMKEGAAIDDFTRPDRIVVGTSSERARQVMADDIPADRAAIVTWPQFYLGAYYYQHNELAAAEKYLQPLVAQPYLSQANCFLNSAVLLARIRQRQGQPEAAQQIAQFMTSFALETNSEVVLLGARAFQAELAWRQGRLAEAGQWAAQSGKFRRVILTFPLAPPLVLARILVAQDTPASRQQARELLTQMDDYYGSIHFTAIRIAVLALLALLHSAEGDEQQALAALSHSIALAEPGGFIRLFVDLGLVLKPLLKKLVQRGVSPRYLADILAAFEAEDARPPAGQPPRTEPVLSDSALLTNREQEVLKLLARRYTDKEIAESLNISLVTVRSHVTHLGEKLGVHGRRAIVQAATDQRRLS